MLAPSCSDTPMKEWEQQWGMVGAVGEVEGFDDAGDVIVRGVRTDGEALTRIHPACLDHATQEEVTRPLRRDAHQRLEDRMVTAFSALGEEMMALRSAILELPSKMQQALTPPAPGAEQMLTPPDR